MPVPPAPAPITCGYPTGVITADDPREGLASPPRQVAAEDDGGESLERPLADNGVERRC